MQSSVSNKDEHDCNDALAALESLERPLMDFYGALSGLCPRQCTLLMSHLFRLKDLATPGLSAHDVDALLNRIGQAERDLIQHAVAKVRATLASTDIVYLSGSHWSPAVDNRQSVIACRSTMVGLRETRMAIAFFAITLDSDRSDLWSLVQYLAQRAPKPEPTFTQLSPSGGHFESPIEVAITVSKINDSLRDCLVHLIQGQADRYGDGDSPERESALLRNYLLYGKPHEPRPRWLSEVLAQYADVCDQALSGQTNTTALRELTLSLQSAFGDPTLEERQVGFICAMQAVWQQAFGGIFLYAFPAVFGKVCCVLTAGANKPLAQDKVRLLLRFSQSLFARALIHDYHFLLKFDRCASPPHPPTERLPPCLNTSSSIA